jgi:PAS domain S-box-containing protein
MRSSQPKVAPFKSYGIALLAVVIAFVATHASWPALQPTPWALFFLAVMVSAWIGGMGPSLVATALAAILGNIYFLAPYGSATLARSGLIPTATFLAVSLFIGALASARRRAEAFERAERTRFQATMTSIGDAVIATDAEGRVTFLNRVAEKLTGWVAREAEGKRLEEVFPIVNEETRAPVPNPVAKVLETGHVQGLANHTVLIARDGTERPIDDSAAPIRDDAGNLAGVVLVFRDISERKAAESDRARLAAIVESSDDAIVGKTLDGVIRFWNAGAERVF